MKRLFLLFLLFSFAARAQQTINWPNNKKAVVVLTYDDGLNSQLNVAIPQLDSLHLTATFFLTGYFQVAGGECQRLRTGQPHPISPMFDDHR